MLDRGKLVVLAMFALAIAAASFAWWWNYTRGRRALEFYGPKAASLIRTAPQVEILIVEDGDGSERTRRASDMVIPFGGVVRRRIDISKAPGLIHARTSLLDDASYQWGSFRAPQLFRHFVRFADEKDEVVLAISEPGGCIIKVIPEGEGSEQLVEKTAHGWWNFLDRNVKQVEEDGKQHH